MRSLSPRVLRASGGILLLLYGSAYLWPSGPTGILWFMVIAVAASSIVGWLAFRSVRAGKEGPGLPLWQIVAFALAFRLVLVPLAPVASDDIYRYLWDGMIGAHGINPFRFAPADPALAHFATAELPSRINFPEMRTIYPPVAQWFFTLTYTLFGASVAGVKVLLVAADLVLVLLLAKVLIVLERPVHYALWYAWSPLPVLYTALDGHVDPLAIVFFMGFLLLWLRRTWSKGSISLAASVLVKLHPLMALPMLAREGGMRKTAGVFGIVVLAVFATCFPYLEPSGGLFESLGIFSSTFSFNGPLYTLAVAATSSTVLARVICAVSLLGMLGWLAAGRLPLPAKLLWSYGALLVCSPVAHPWYFQWIAVLIPLHWSLTAFAATGLVSLSNIVVFRYWSGQPWVDDPLVLSLQYLPVALLGLWELAHGKG